MATYTEHYNLIKPALNDKVNINNLNDNADIIDAALNNKVNTDDTQNIKTSANNCMMSDGVTSVEDALDEAVGEVKAGADAINTTHTIRVAHLIKAGKIVCCSISLTFTSNVSAWTTIASLTGVKLVASTLCNAVAGGTICQAYTTTNGNIQISIPGTSGQDATITVVGIASN